MSHYAEHRSPLERSALQAAAGPDWSVQLYDATSSTNAVAAADPVAGSVVVTAHQTAGRGRLGRAWQTPADTALTFSAVVDPQVEARWWPVISLVTGLAMARTIGPRAGLKWPNDVQIDGRKVCGILVERVEAEPPVAVIGIGLNVCQTPEEIPVENGTSMLIEGLEPDRTRLLGLVLAELRTGLDRLREDPDAVLSDYRAHSTTIGQRVRVMLPGADDLTGLAVGVDEWGRLVVQPESGEPVAVSAGDVVHVRPAG